MSERLTLLPKKEVLVSGNWANFAEKIGEKLDEIKIFSDERDAPLWNLINLLLISECRSKYRRKISDS